MLLRAALMFGLLGIALSGRPVRADDIWQWTHEASGEGWAHVFDGGGLREAADGGL